MALHFAHPVLEACSFFNAWGLDMWHKPLFSLETGLSPNIRSVLLLGSTGGWLHVGGRVESWGSAKSVAIWEATILSLPYYRPRWAPSSHSLLVISKNDCSDFQNKRFWKRFPKKKRFPTSLSFLSLCWSTWTVTLSLVAFSPVVEFDWFVSSHLPNLGALMCQSYSANCCFSRW